MFRTAPVSLALALTTVAGAAIRAILVPALGAALPPTAKRAPIVQESTQ